MRLSNSTASSDFDFEWPLNTQKHSSFYALYRMMTLLMTLGDP